MVVKRYSNRRLYDTDESRYVTLDEVAERIRAGSEIRFVDAPTGEDITQMFLAQIILEGRGAARLLPVPLLYRMVRMGDDALAEFFGRYVTWALDVYLKLKQGARSMASYGPFGQMPHAAGEALARWLGSVWGQSQSAPPPGWPPGAGASSWAAPPAGWGPPAPADTGFPPPPTPEVEPDVAPEPEPPPARPAPAEAPASDALAAMRAEIEALKQVIREAVGQPAARSAPPAEPPEKG